MSFFSRKERRLPNSRYLRRGNSLELVNIIC
jgi:hypothetical protein